MEERIYFEGDEAKYLYLVAMGKVKLVRNSASGLDVLLDILHGGDYFGSFSTLGGRVHSETAIAQTDCCILRISAEDFDRILSERPDVTRKVLEAVTQRLAESQEIVKQLSTYTAEQRIASALMRLAGRLGEARSGGVLIQLPFSRQDLAAMTGSTVETVSRGTVRAIQGLDIVESKPFFCPGPGVDLLKHVAGGDDYRYLRASRGALYDLQPVSYGSLIDWLDHQPHPDIAYSSVIRSGPVGDGDELVTARSQDLNQIPVLHGRVQVLVAPTSHRLEPRDGILLADILERKN